jgi:hypothetical protein
MSDRKPKNLVVVLLDSLNRHMLEAYGGREFATPHIAAFSRDALRFTRHHAGSLPCMPARHDILVGALDFPWRPWGSIEIWEDNIARALRQAGVTTMLASDHPHLFETGGENYHTDFNAWQYARGHEGDPWHTTADPTWVGTPALPAERGAFGHANDDSRTYFRSEEDFPGPKTMSAATQWIRTEAPAHDRFFLFVDEFDPHKPFDTPLPYAGLYNDDWDGPLSIWPPYLIDATASGQLDARTARHIRANYGSKLTMIDHWFGRLLEAIDQQGLAASTGIWGRHVGVTDGRFRYLRGCGEDNFALSVWSNRWSTMPIPPFPQIRLPRPEGRATLDRMPGTEVPVIRQPFEPGDQLPFWAGHIPPPESYPLDTDADPFESENQVGTRAENALRDAVATELRSIGAPSDLLERIGVA